jgi:hypothetical protein
MSNQTDEDKLVLLYRELGTHYEVIGKTESDIVHCLNKIRVLQQGIAKAAIAKMVIDDSE